MTPRTPTFRLSVEPLEDRSVPVAGFIDPTFDVDGVATVNVGAEEYAHDVAVYPTGTANAGKVVVAGGAAPIGGSGLDTALVRFNPDGSLDPTFGQGGTVRQPLVSKGEDQAMAVAVVGDKILTGGYVIPGSLNADFVLARFNADGTLDTTFGSKGSGRVQTDFGRGTDFGMAMAVQADGKIVLAGLTHPANAPSNYTVFAVARYNPNGTLDSTFGKGGEVTVDVGESLRTGTDRYMDLALSADKIIVVGSASTGGTATNNLYVVRLTPTGQPDPGFGTGGVARPGQGSCPSLAVQPDGGVVVSSNFNQAINVTRLLANGAVDAGFGSGGTASLSWSATGPGDASGVAIDALGRVLVGGRAGDGSGVNGRLVVARFTSDGVLDQAYGSGGFGTTGSAVNLSTGLNALAALALEPDGAAVVVGTTANDWRFAAARFQGDSALTAAAVAPSSPSRHAPAIMAADTQGLLAEAISRWAAAGVDVSSLAGVQLHVADLGGGTLGLAAAGGIWVDDDAAGWGWFVDPTPADDSEFLTPGNQGELRRMDLLSVLEHEVGHLLGHDHSEGGVMSAALAPGERLTFGGVYDADPQAFAAPPADDGIDPLTGRRKG